MKAKPIVLILIVAVSFVGFVYFFGIGGAIAGIFESLLLYVLCNPDRAVGNLATVYKQLRNVNFWFEKNAVEKRLESNIGLSSKKVNEEGIDLFQHGVDVKWSNPEDRDAFLKDGKIVVCLEPSTNEARNLARATMLYTKQDLVRESQRFIDTKVLMSACLTMSRKMLMMERNLDAFRCLNEEFLEPETSRSPKVENYIEIMEKLDSEGCFTRLLLLELSQLDAKLSPTISSPRAQKETVSFMEIMKKLAEKEKGVDINPTHRGQIIDFSIMLVARKGVKNPNRYIKYVEKCWKEGVPVLYALAQEKNVMVAVAAVMAIKNSGIYRVEKEWKFWVPRKRRGFTAYIAVLSRVEK